MSWKEENMFFSILPSISLMALKKEGENHQVTLEQKNTP